MLDKAFVIGNGIGRQVFYQTWSCRRARKVRVLGSGRWGEAQQALHIFSHSDDSETEASAISFAEQEQISCIWLELFSRIMVAFHILSPRELF